MFKEELSLVPHLPGSYQMKNKDGLNCKIYALSRNVQKASEKFTKWIGNDLLSFITYDIKHPLVRNDLEIRKKPITKSLKTSTVIISIKANGQIDDILEP